jgi:hypothetical protein
MLGTSTWLHSAFAMVHLGLLLVLLIQTAFTQQNLASSSVLQVSHDAVATLWYITLAVILGRVISSAVWMYVWKSKRMQSIQETPNEKPVAMAGLSRWESILTLVSSALVVFPSAILLGAGAGATSATYVERGRDKNMLLIIWILFIQGVWAFLELAWSHVDRLRQKVKAEKQGINRFLLIVVIVLMLAFAFTSAITFYDTYKLYMGTTFNPGSEELKGALYLIYVFGILQFAFTLLTVLLYAFKSMVWADKSVVYNLLVVVSSALSFEFVAILYGATLPHTSVVDVLRHSASMMSSIPTSGSLMTPNLATLYYLTTSNFFVCFAFLVVVHLAAFSRMPRT